MTMGLRRLVSAGLVERGFERQGGTHLRPLEGDFSHWVEIGPLGAGVDISPFLGLRHEGVARTRCALLDLPPDAWSGTVGANIGHLLEGRYRSWPWPTDPEVVLAAITSALEVVRPYAADLTSLDRVWADIPATAGPETGYQRCVIALLRADRQAALDALDRARAEYCRREDAGCARFRGFEAGITPRIAALD